MTEEREQFLSDILTTAVEGGIGYWASLRHVERDSELNVLSFDCMDYEDPEAGWKNVDRNDIDTALAQVRAERVRINSQAREMLLDADNGEDASMIDAELADCLVQIAVYGELVFS